ncbi:hypothetical protein HAX54_031411 [Datura stramonium]|uniref:Uncharacterized protein n=1 Tax=Datura stramonium TaxID=4076 RepID=A0ABS8VA07_DATST|nr:hypothetical protein [Datura stramonium]
MSSGNSGAKEAEELHPHPVMEQLKNVQCCVVTHHLGEALFLGFQHYILSLGNIVLIPSIIVPQMGGGNDEKAKVVQTLLFTSGVNTLLQSLFKDQIAIEVYVYNEEYTGGTYCYFWFPNSTGLPWPVEKFCKIAECIEVGIPQLIFMVVITQYLPTYLKLKRPICDRFAMLFSIAIVWFYAAILTWSGAFKNANEANCRTDSSGLIAGSPCVCLQLASLYAGWCIYPFNKVPTFKFGEAFTMMIASFVAFVESTGVFHASARYGALPVPPSVISRGVGWLENLEQSLLQYLHQSWLQYTVSSLDTYQPSAGLGFLQFCNLNSFRTKFILGFSLFLGLSLPQYFQESIVCSGSGPLHTHSRWFNDTMSVIFTSHAMMAAVVACIFGSDSSI